MIVQRNNKKPKTLWNLRNAGQKEKAVAITCPHVTNSALP